MFRAAKEIIKKRFGRIWNPTGAKKMPTPGRKKPVNIMGGTLRHGAVALLGGLSQFSRVPEFRLEEDEEEQAAMSDIDIDYLE